MGLATGADFSGIVDKVELLIRQPTESEFLSWRPLWNSYLEFYQTELPPESATSLWERILNPKSNVRCHVASQNEELIGLVHFLAHENTWSNHPVCYLQDLYVDPSHRGEGVGAKLIDSVVKQAKSEGWEGVYWLTAEDNHSARGLYDSLTGGTTGFVHYEMDTTSDQAQDETQV